jgi:hypothetical protein
VRSGGYEPNWTTAFGALWIFASLSAISSLSVHDIEIQDSSYQGLLLSGEHAIDAASSAGVSISNATTLDIEVTASGSGTFERVTVANASDPKKRLRQRRFPADLQVRLVFRARPDEHGRQRAQRLQRHRERSAVHRHPLVPRLVLPGVARSRPRAGVRELRDLAREVLPGGADLWMPDMNYGQYFHFMSGAAGVDLAPLARQAFQWHPDFDDEIAAAKVDFPDIKY